MKVIKEIFKYSELLKNNVKKEIRGRYKNSVLGALWTFLNPLLQLLVYATIFPLLFRNSQDNYVIFVCVGLIPWTFFTSVVSQSASTIIGNGNIVKKVYFPREILPLSVVLSGAVNFLISTLLILAFCMIYKLGITIYILYFPLILLVQMIIQLAISLVVSSVTVYFRDLEHFVQIALMLMFYATPVVYSIESMPPDIARFLKLNPMVAIIEGYRAIFYYQKTPNLKMLSMWGAISIVMVLIAVLIFRKLQKGFAEEL